jgi:uncharacterized LabA/DUF88 family protein
MNYAFIDGQNLKLSTESCTQPFTVDLKKFRIYLNDKYNVSRAFYFMGFYVKENDELYKLLITCGYEVVFRDHSEYALSRKKGNVDTEIVFKMMTCYIDDAVAEKYLLVSGDGDYFQVVQYLISKDKFLKLLIPSHMNASSLYKHIPDTFIDYLDRKEIRKKIELK